jgi:SAM-dependent methyltransferase
VEVSRVLDHSEDAFGRLLLEYLAGRPGWTILERDDGHTGSPFAAQAFFRQLDQWPAPERKVFGYTRGRVLDVGCGAGRHSLAAQDLGLVVVAIDISPGAVEVSSRRGVRDVRLLPLAQVDERLGTFDTVLMMCGNFGLAGNARECARTLRMLHRITEPDARVILDSEDPYMDNDPADSAYLERNRSAGRMPGQVTIRLRYQERVTPWFDLLVVSPSELAVLAEQSGWRVAHVIAGDPPDYYAVLEKAERQGAAPVSCRP